MGERIYLSSPKMSSDGYEMAYIKEAFDTNWVGPLGENVDKFEEEMAEKVNVNAAAALSSGTAAIHLALKAAGVGKGDIVICPTLTFAASANPIIYQGATPVFVDSDYKTWNMDPELLEKALQKYPEAKAVIVVHLYGISADLTKIMEICKKYDVKLIEDAAESLGTKYKGQYTGTFGDFGIYSFNGNKIITTSGGGMLVSNDKEAIEKARYWAYQSRDNVRYYQHRELGYNYRMGNILSGIGRGQIKVLDDRVKKKREIYNYYKEKLSSTGLFEFMPMNEDDYSNCWLTSALLKEGINPEELIDFLEDHNIEARNTWKPMHTQPYYESYDVFGGKVAEDIFNRGICLPSDTNMKLEDQNRVIACIKSKFSAYI